MEKNNRKLFVLILLGLLTTFGLVIEIVSFIRNYSNYSVIRNFNLAAYTITSILLLYYALSGYKNPHGNLLKYLFLLFAICCLSAILTIREVNTTNDMIYNSIRGIVVLMTGYVSGRLDNVKENITLMPIISILMLASSFVGITSFTDLSSTIDNLDNFTFFILWIDLVVAYTIRYKEHREAGLEK